MSLRNKRKYVKYLKTFKIQHIKIRINIFIYFTWKNIRLNGRKSASLYATKKATNLRALVIGFYAHRSIGERWGGDLDSHYCFSFIYFESVLSLYCIGTRKCFVVWGHECVPFHLICFPLHGVVVRRVPCGWLALYYRQEYNIVLWSTAMDAQPERYFRGVHSCSVRP